MTLSAVEAAELSARYGSDKVYLSRWGEWRTRVRGGSCTFLVNNSCTIHADPAYPSVCRSFPWTDAETGGAYEYDQTICPEFVANPELLLLGKPDRQRP